MKKMLLTVSLLLILGASAFASDTRVLTMGHNNNILSDDANIWLYPSRIGFYPDLAIAEFGNPDYYYYAPKAEGEWNAMTKLGLNFKVGDDNPHVIGLYLHNNVPLYNMFSPIGPVEHGPYDYYYYNAYSNKKMDLFWGKMFGTTNVGAHIGMVCSSNEEEDEDDLDKRKFSQMNIDLGATMMNGKLDIAIGFEKFSFEDIDTRFDSDADQYVGVDDYEDDGNTTIYARARYFYELNPSYTVIPHFGFVKGSYKHNDYDWDDAEDTNILYRTAERSLTDFDLGAGLNYTPSTNVLAILDFGVKMTNYKYERNYDSTGVSGHYSVYDTESTGKYFVLPYFKAGFEADVFKWMDIRFGATSYWTKYTDEYDYNVPDDADASYADKYTESYPLNTTYLGFGFHWDRLSVDCYTDPELFLNGFDFISGDGDGDMNCQISATYEMF